MHLGHSDLLLLFAKALGTVAAPHHATHAENAVGKLLQGGEQHLLASWHARALFETSPGALKGVDVDLVLPGHMPRQHHHHDATGPLLEHLPEIRHHYRSLIVFKNWVNIIKGISFGYDL